MNRISFGIALVLGMTFTFATAHAERRVMSGALDICQSVDNGTTIIENGVEACCAQEVTEFDDGHIEFGANYCVACTVGTDDCIWSDRPARSTPQHNLKNALTSVPKQRPKN